MGGVDTVLADGWQDVGCNPILDLFSLGHLGPHDKAIDIAFGDNGEPSG